MELLNQAVAAYQAALSAAEELPDDHDLVRDIQHNLAVSVRRLRKRGTVREWVGDPE